MRYIPIQDHVSAEATRGAGHHTNVPLPVPNVPVYRGVHQALVQAGGAGAISFMNALAAEGQKAVAEQQQLYDKIELSTALSEADKEFMTESDQWLQDNVSGKGYMDFATSKYDEISKKYLDNASSSVRDQMQLIFLNRKNSIANAAFQQEKEIYTGYALNQTQMQLDQTMNEVMLHPEQADSLRVKFEQQLSNMQHILAGNKYEQYKNAQIQEFIFRQGQGTIQSRPNAAESLIKNEYYSRALEPSKYNQLLHNARTAREHAEYTQQVQAHAAETAAKQQMLSDSYEMECNMRMGVVYDQSMIDNTIFTPQIKSRLLRVQKECIKKQTREIDVSNCVYSELGCANPKTGQQPSSTNMHIEDVKPEEINKCLGDLVDMWNTEREAGQEQPMSYTEQALFLEQHSDKIRVPFNRLKKQCVTTIETSTDGKKLIDACIATGCAANTPTFNHSDMKDSREFAEIVSEVYANDPQGALKFRDDWFNPQSSIAKGATERWQQKLADLSGATREEKKQQFIKDFYRDNDLLGQDAWFFKDSLDTGDGQILGDIVFDAYEKTFKRTGSEYKAGIVAKSIVENHVKKIGDEYIINPPTPQNTGLSEEQITERINKAIIKAAIHSPELKVVKDLKGNYTSKVMLGDKEVKIRLECVSSDLAAPQYRLYYLADPDDTRSRNYLYNGSGMQYLLDLTPRRKHG